jgi:hypothetical protein
MGGDKDMEITYSHKFSDIFPTALSFKSAVASSDMFDLDFDSTGFADLVWKIINQTYADEFLVYEDIAKAEYRLMETFFTESPKMQKIWLMVIDKLASTWDERNFQKVEEMTNDITRDINRSTTVDRDTEANEFTKQADTPTIKDSSDDFVDDYANMMRKGNVGTQEDSVTALAETSGEDTVNVKVGSLAVLFEIYNRIPADLYIKIIRPYAKHFQLFYD